MSWTWGGCRTVAGLLTAAALLAGCTAVTSGTARRAAGGPPAGTVDVALLDPGNYPTTARKPLGVAGSAATGALLDAQRMADFVAGPWEVDPTLTDAKPFGFSPGAMPLKAGPTILEVIAPPPVAAAGDRNHYLYGYATARQVAGSKIVFNVVLRMASPADAVTAAREMAQALHDTPPTPTAVMTVVPIPGHPDTAAVGYPYTVAATGAAWNYVEAFTAHGPYVLMERAELTDTAEAAATLVGKLIDVQAPRIDGFAATDPAGFAELPRDPDGLLALSLPTPKDAGTVNNDATFGPAGLLHYFNDPIVTATQIRDAGLDAAASANGWVYRTRDTAAATTLRDRVASSDGTEGVPNLPGSRCAKLTSHSGFSCTASVGRYVFDVSSAQLKDVHQQAAAQYLLLAGA